MFILHLTIVAACFAVSQLTIMATCDAYPAKPADKRDQAHHANNDPLGGVHD